MVLNPNCVRDVLLWLETSLDIDGDYAFKPVYLQNLYDAMPNYSQQNIYYSVYNLFQIRHIEGKLQYLPNGELKQCEIQNITWSGHQFLNHIRPKTIWDATKEYASQLGLNSIFALETIAFEIVKETVTQKSVIAKITSKILDIKKSSVL